MTNYYDELETRDQAIRARAQIQAVAEQVAHAKAKAPHYGKLLAEVDPGTITSAEAIARLPLTRKSELIELQREARPFGGLTTVVTPELTHLFASPGPIYEPGTQRKDFWRMARAMYAAGFRPGEVIHNCFSYHFVPAGMMLESGAHALGCAVIPAGVGQTELQVQTITDLKPDGYVGTPSFLKIILEKADAMKADMSSLKKALVSGEALPPTLREGFNKRGIQVLQCYATADLGVIAYETEAMQGLVIDEGAYVEIVRPGTGEPVADGEVGEVVVTSLNPDYPLIRFATGDLSAIMTGESPCGRTNRRIKGWMGRADQTAKVRGMFIHPEQVDKVIKRHPEIRKARLVVDWVNESDQLLLQYECDSQSSDLDSAIATSIREICKVRGETRPMPIDSLPNDGKVIDDIRKYD